jgi:phosphoribosylformylglycinamidine synthase PurS subunit
VSAPLPVTLHFNATVTVLPKEGVLDPEGQAIERALKGLGFSEVETVHAGKVITLSLTAADRAEAERRVREMAERLLANPIIQRYTLRIEESA